MTKPRISVRSARWRLASASVLLAVALLHQDGAFGQEHATPTQQRPYQNLWIPPALAGKIFNLTLSKNRKSFWPGATTDTYGYNNCAFWGPTLILNQGDAVQLNIRNNLDEVTTVHWHGLHLPAIMDGGPHQIIPPGGVWTSSFVVKNNAATYWYHPHPHEKTQKQLTMGAGGLIIIKDPVEAKLGLPRTYGVDDIPLTLSSRRFYPTQQFSSEGDRDKYGDFPFVNGTLDAQVSLPAQFVRLRILNAEIERGYILGFSDNRPFHVIATDGGLVDKPIAVTRLKLMVGERVELLVDLNGDRPGAAVDLMAYNAGQPFGFPGGEPGSSRPNGSYLNNLNFRLLHINVAAPSAGAVTKLPPSLTRNRFWTDAEVTNRRTVRIGGGGPPDKEFRFDGKYFDMRATNQVVKLGATEAWTIENDRIFGHSFHIHDVQFKIVSRSDGPVPEYEQGWKDTLYLPRATSATFIARFDDYASDTDPFMYHCHMANHEDGGLMGQFVVSRDPGAIRRDALGLIRFRDCLQYPLTAGMIEAARRQFLSHASVFAPARLNEAAVRNGAAQDSKPLVAVFVERSCPCSRTIASYLAQIAESYHDGFRLVGVINADESGAQAWAAATGATFPMIADPELTVAKSYGAERAATVIVIAPGGRIIRGYPGYSAEMLRELSSQLASVLGVANIPLSFDGAPAELVGGCPLTPFEPEAEGAPSVAAIDATTRP